MQQSCQFFVSACACVCVYLKLTKKKVNRVILQTDRPWKLNIIKMRGLNGGLSACFFNLWGLKSLHGASVPTSVWLWSLLPVGQRFCLGTGQRPRRWLNLLLVHATGGKKNRILDVDVYSHMFPVQPDCWARPYKIIGTTSESCYNIYIQNTLLTGNNNLVNKLFFSNQIFLQAQHK
jgi:hypothetical protein